MNCPQYEHVPAAGLSSPPLLPEPFRQYGSPLAACLIFHALSDQAGPSDIGLENKG